MTASFWIETLGCPKNRVDSDKLAGRLGTNGLRQAVDMKDADLVIVNTCAFIEAARMESIETILELSDQKKPNAKVVVTGCMAERYGEELASELPEVDLVAGFGQELVDPNWFEPITVPVKLSVNSSRQGSKYDFDLLNLSRPSVQTPWAYIKIAEGCNRACGFCAIPSFRGKQKSRTIEDIVQEVESLDVKEAVLVAQDLASYGSDLYGSKRLTELVKALTGKVEWLRLLYIYPSELNPGLIEAILSTGIAYFDLSLQHSSRPLLARMKRWGSGEKFLERIEYIRSLDSKAVFRSSFIVGYPGETEEDHDNLLQFIKTAELDWAGFFTFSDEAGTYANRLDKKVDRGLMMERLAEVSELQDRITANRRSSHIGTEVLALVESEGVARSYMEAPEIDGVLRIDQKLPVGSFIKANVISSEGPDLLCEVVR